MARLSSEVTRGLNDYLGWLEAEYDIRIEAHDLSDYIVEGVDQYQAEFDAAVRDFRDAVDKIEKMAFDFCDSVEEDDPTDVDEKTDEVLREARDRILKESGRLTERLNSLNLRPSWRLSSPPLASSTEESRILRAWTCAEGCGRIEGAGGYEQHRTLYPVHHPHVSDEVGLPRDGGHPLV
ncbi:MAG: hypothetical protein ABSB26_07885 [Nitrososphaerales archaeon]